LRMYQSNISLSHTPPPYPGRKGKKEPGKGGGEKGALVLRTLAHPSHLESPRSTRNKRKGKNIFERKKRNWHNLLARREVEGGKKVTPTERGGEENREMATAMRPRHPKKKKGRSKERGGEGGRGRRSLTPHFHLSLPTASERREGREKKKKRGKGRGGSVIAVRAVYSASTPDRAREKKKKGSGRREKGEENASSVALLLSSSSERIKEKRGGEGIVHFSFLSFFLCFFFFFGGGGVGGGFCVFLGGGWGIGGGFFFCFCLSFGGGGG